MTSLKSEQWGRCLWIHSFICCSIALIHWCRIDPQQQHLDKVQAGEKINGHFIYILYLIRIKLSWLFIERAQLEKHENKTKKTKKDDDMGMKRTNTPQTFILCGLQRWLPQFIHQPTVKHLVDEWVFMININFPFSLVLPRDHGGGMWASLALPKISC